MNELVLFAGNTLPTLIDAVDANARTRFLEFFTASIRNPNTRRAQESVVPHDRPRRG